MKYLLLLLISSTAIAGPTLKIGGCIDEDQVISLFNNKFAAIGYQNHIKNTIFDYQIEGGYFADATKGILQQTLFAGPSIGLSIENSGHYTKVFFGPSIVSHTDERLSIPFEFNADFEFGFQDSRGVGMGIGFKHMSSAGLGSPNLGRDFLYLQISLP